MVVYIVTGASMPSERPRGRQETDIDAAEVLRWVARLAGDEDPRYARIVALLTRQPPRLQSKRRA